MRVMNGGYSLSVIGVMNGRYSPQLLAKRSMVNIIRVVVVHILICRGRCPCGVVVPDFRTGRFSFDMGHGRIVTVRRY